jgi:hypothetical protein
MMNGNFSLLRPGFTTLCPGMNSSIIIRLIHAQDIQDDALGDCMLRMSNDHRYYLHDYVLDIANGSQKTCV